MTLEKNPIPVRLHADTKKHLQELAKQGQRKPGQQARMYIERGIEQDMKAQNLSRPAA